MSHCCSVQSLPCLPQMFWKLPLFHSHQKWRTIPAAAECRPTRTEMMLRLIHGPSRDMEETKRWFLQSSLNMDPHPTPALTGTKLGAKHPSQTQKARCIKLLALLKTRLIIFSLNRISLVFKHFNVMYSKMWTSNTWWVKMSLDSKHNN